MAKRQYKGTLRSPGGRPQDVDLVLDRVPQITSAEAAAGIQWVDDRYEPGNVLRYGTNTTPGTTDLATAITNCLSANAICYLPEEDVAVGSKITLATGNAIIGHGGTTDNTTAGKSRILRTFTGSDPTILASGDDCSLQNVDIDNDSKGTGECVKVTGTRFKFLGLVSCRKSGGDGVRVGDTEAGASSINANLGHIQFLAVLNNAGNGIKFDHTNTDTTATFAGGIPDCNAWYVGHVDARGNTGDGIYLGNTIDNTFVSAVCQSNTGYGIHLAQYARGHIFLKPYTEGNTGATPSSTGELILDSGATHNIIYGSRMGLVSPVWTDNGSANQIITYYDSVENDEWVHQGPFNIWNNATGGTALMRMYADDGEILAAYLEASEVGTSGGQLDVFTKRDGNTPVRRVRLDEKGNVVVNNAAIATTATDGFLYVPSCAGTPTGTPTTHTGMVPIVVDTTNNKLYFYSGGSWRDAGP